VKIPIILITLAIAALICGCISQDVRSSHGQIRVATTISPLGEFISAIGKDRVDVTVLVPPGGEPHTFDPTPSQIRKVADADIYIENGAGLESWMSRIIQVNDKMLVIDSSKNIDLIIGSSDDKHLEETSRVDPHTWVSLRNAKIQVENICDGLIQISAKDKDYFIKNRDDYLRELSKTDSYLNASLSGLKRNEFIVLHPAWSYFARDYRLKEIAINLDEKEPGPKYLQDLIELAKANNITTIFVEPQFNQKMADVIAKEINGKVVAIDPLAINYTKNMKIIGDLISESLKD
jgi:zinc transport system substrate-binding protein